MVGVGLSVPELMRMSVGDPAEVGITGMSHEIAPKPWIERHGTGSVVSVLHLDDADVQEIGHDYQRWSVTPKPGHLPVGRAGRAVDQGSGEFGPFGIGPTAAPGCCRSCDGVGMGAGAGVGEAADGAPDAVSNRFRGLWPDVRDASGRSLCHAMKND
jgi:hypothetical protein